MMLAQIMLGRALTSTVRSANDGRYRKISGRGLDGDRRKVCMKRSSIFLMSSEKSPRAPVGILLIILSGTRLLCSRCLEADQILGVTFRFGRSGPTNAGKCIKR